MSIVKLNSVNFQLKKIPEHELQISYCDHLGYDTVLWSGMWVLTSYRNIRPHLKTQTCPTLQHGVTLQKVIVKIFTNIKILHMN